MKTVYVTLLVFIGFFAKSQQTEELKANPWQINKVILNGIEYPYIQPPDPGYYQGLAEFYDYYFYTGFCLSDYIQISYSSNNNSFTLGDGGGIFDCDNDYDPYYFGVLGGGPEIRSFTYEIQDFGSNKVLTLTNENGDKAIYNSGILGVSDISGASQAKIYPNPAMDVINIASDKKIANVSVFDASGKVVKTTTETAVNIQNLAKGSYVVSIKYADGTVESRKVIKK